MSLEQRYLHQVDLLGCHPSNFPRTVVGILLQEVARVAGAATLVAGAAVRAVVVAGDGCGSCPCSTTAGSVQPVTHHNLGMSGPRGTGSRREYGGTWGSRGCCGDLARNGSGHRLTGSVAGVPWVQVDEPLWRGGGGGASRGMPSNSRRPATQKVEGP